MTDTGFIKLHRKILDNPISSRPLWAWLWVYLILKANHEDKEIIWNGKPLLIKRGQLLTGLKTMRKESGVTTQSIRSALDYLKLTNQVTIQTTNKWRIITICNYEQYQQVTIKLTNQQQTNNKQITTNKNDKNDKNILSKDNKVKDRNGVVDFVLEQFKSRYGFSPIDKKPRQVAYNISQITNTFIKNYGSIYEVKKGEKADVQTIITRVFDKFLEEDFAKDTQYLDTFKRHLKKILEITGNKLTQVTNSPSVQ